MPTRIDSSLLVADLPILLAAGRGVLASWLRENLADHLDEPKRTRILFGFMFRNRNLYTEVLEELHWRKVAEACPLDSAPERAYKIPNLI
jgi:hypothetical protein